MTLASGIHVLSSSSPHISTILDGIAHVHASCILHDNTVATFLPPLSHARMYQHWNSLLAETKSRRRLIIVSLSPISNRTAGLQIEPPFPPRNWPVLQTIDSLEVSGIISLSLPTSQTGPFRGLVQNLFISPLHRRKGIATEFLVELEARALGLGRWNLMLDTIAGTPAEAMYLKLGWEKLGLVRDYGYSPEDGRLVDEVFFWKDLRDLKRPQGGKNSWGRMATVANGLDALTRA
jgi:GNAT superfamily N-acetyltransferase